MNGIQDSVNAIRVWSRVAATAVTAWDIARRAKKVPTEHEGLELCRRSLLLQEGASRLLRSHGIAVAVEGSIPSGPVVLACNHVSWLDPLVVGSLVPIIPISKREVADWPGVGKLVRDLGVIFYNRHDRLSGMRVMREALRVLDSGLSVLNFPEGTTTDGGGLLEFRYGLFGVALQATVPVVPVAISYASSDMAWIGKQTFFPHYIKIAKKKYSLARVSFGVPLWPQKNGNPREMAQTVREGVRCLLDNQLKKYSKEHCDIEVTKCLNKTHGNICGMG